MDVEREVIDGGMFVVKIEDVNFGVGDIVVEVWFRVWLLKKWG